ncbi:MAG TPA: hypothetical protein VIH05_03820, partial [Tepidiformaceae bacterium]
GRARASPLASVAGWPRAAAPKEFAVRLWRWFWGGFAIGAAIGILRNFTASLYCLGCLVGMFLLVALLVFWNYPQVVVGVIVLIIVLRVLTKSKQQPPPSPGSPTVEPQPPVEARPLAVEPGAAIASEPSPPAPRRKKWDGPYIPPRKRRPE